MPIGLNINENVAANPSNKLVTDAIGVINKPNAPFKTLTTVVIRLLLAINLPIDVIACNIVIPNTLLNKLPIAMIGAIKAHIAPPKIINTPIILATAGCASNNLATNCAKPLMKLSKALAIGAIAVPKATSILMMLPIKLMITGPFCCTYCINCLKPSDLPTCSDHVLN